VAGARGLSECLELRANLDRRRRRVAVKIDVDISVLVLAAHEVQKRCEHLDDIIPELANTFANIYYKAMAMVVNKPYAYNILYKDISTALKDHANFSTAVGIIPDWIRAYRRDLVNIDLAEYASILLLDQIKYNIPRALEKSLFRRTIERKFSSPFPEIDDLYPQMRLFIHPKPS
jgi:hypothetical protein